jgi:hypothetical protein
MTGIPSQRKLSATLVLTFAVLHVSHAVAAPSPSDSEALRMMVEADWAAQEARWGRTPDTPQAVRQAWQRADMLLRNLKAMPDGPEFDSQTLALRQLRSKLETIESLDQPARLALYLNIRRIARRLALNNPLVASKRILFMKRRRFICQMLHEYLGYFYDYGDISGGGIYVLERPGLSLDTEELIAGRLPTGNYTTLALSYDARTIYFAFAERAPSKPDYYSAQRRCFHIYAMDADGAGLRQLTEGLNDDFDPCPLPDRSLAFMSTRRGGFGRCHNPWEPLPSYTLHRLDPASKEVRTLSFHETNEWHPSVMADGRIVYCRWDYVDRSAANYHGLWASNPDGTNPSILFGNYTQRINACFQPRAIPGSNRIIFVAGAHHANVGGSLVLLDPGNARLDPASGQDIFASIEVLTPEVCFPEAPGWPKSYFHSPWPLSEDHFLVSFSFDPLPGMGPGVKDDTYTGLYYFDRFGNLELLYRESGISCMYPIPLVPRSTPRAIPSTPDPSLGDEGRLILADVTRSLFPLPPDRQIKQLRVFQVLPKTYTHVANKPRVGYANAESTRMMLGTVDVESDGSAYFRAPARKPLYFQALDEEGRAVQTMRSVTYLQPGEQRSCLGCHEPRHAAPVNRRALLALRRPPSRIEPGPEGTRPFSYPLLVQPVLNRHCVSCHDGRAGQLKSRLVLTGQIEEQFTKSYQSLRKYVRWYEWGGSTITEVATKPGRIGSDESSLLNVLQDQIHSKHVRLSQDDKLRLYIWLDGNAPFYGTYQEDSQFAQRTGQAVPPPRVQ